ncbi:hypothetical protein PAXRUDRAFT_19835 [Paxillus rubicundulus Ve08.2h10]|uniref:DUF6533 domain-containing protein n=1 Tax=Paxillus rubicundulus Ve08.2h10 TaxID=930991 RepID=A0A0D0CTW8_9AGAM|nr:hypothetical protein PAXRUDRAFT_19835 [Paxillus rubicundulus Ve08.2h10]
MSTSELTLLARAQVVKYCRLAPAAIWLFDYFLTFEDEVRVVWGSARLSAVHVLFVIVRYLPVAVLVCAAYGRELTGKRSSILQCSQVYKGLAVMMVFSTILAEGLHHDMRYLSKANAAFFYSFVAPSGRGTMAQQQIGEGGPDNISSCRHPPHSALRASQACASSCL